MRHVADERRDQSLSDPSVCAVSLKLDEVLRSRGTGTHILSKALTP
jgi:hypothetical protein